MSIRLRHTHVTLSLRERAAWLSGPVACMMASRYAHSSQPAPAEPTEEGARSLCGSSTRKLAPWTGSTGLASPSSPGPGLNARRIRSQTNMCRRVEAIKQTNICGEDLRLQLLAPSLSSPVIGNRRGRSSDKRGSSS
ncbi:hypothetical protein CALVIDRAFT_258092 [Calocera viscosa TUFC12733]|uniref:Uncharacterized protein n=1 Tax=Calocera viscosa (strain TUFC12733) TaxID=1330018 RepID=A0A167J218_CALVF|nr:hypothetical protein CALVIDRAFT_258092 [Calocera viscosa TUFC12733]